MSHDEGDDYSMTIFQEPDGFFKVFEPQKFRKSLFGKEYELIGSEKFHAMWGHMVWNASIEIADCICDGSLDFQGKRVVELGAGLGLASLAASLVADFVVAADYPDEEILNPLRKNLSCRDNCLVLAHKWGTEPPPELHQSFDVVILSDVMGNHSEHESLVQSIKSFLKPSGYVLVFFSHHEVKNKEKDLKFFDLCCDFSIEDMESKKMERMFPENDSVYGMIEERSTVYRKKMNLY